MKLRHFNKHFVKNRKKRGPTGKNFGDFSPRYFKTAIWMENVTQRWTQSGLLFFKKKSGHFCRFSKMAGEVSPLFPNYTSVSGAEYASISMKIPKYPWKCLNKLFWLCQGSEYTWSPYMFDKFLKMPWVLSKPEFWIWHSCMCKDCAEFWACLIMAPYPTIMAEYASTCLNTPPYAWTWLSIAQSLWIYLKMPE